MNKNKYVNPFWWKNSITKVNLVKIKLSKKKYIPEIHPPLFIASGAIIMVKYSISKKTYKKAKEAECRLCSLSWTSKVFCKLNTNRTFFSRMIIEIGKTQR